MTASTLRRRPYVTRLVRLVLLALLLFGLLKEIREPYVWLFVHDVLWPKPGPQRVPLDADLAVRLYSDTRPHTGKIARLQKGLVLEVDGRERVEEGFGLGLPLVEVGGRSYLSRAATVMAHEEALVKHYSMDTIDTPSGFLRQKYVPVATVGAIVVTYTVRAEQVYIAVDLSGIPGWERAYIMNEGGAQFFTRYEEPGLAVEGRAFGKWQPTTAQEGCILSADRSVGFCVQTEETLPKYYGRERYNQYYPFGIYTLSWAGVDIELSPPQSLLQYVIRVLRHAPQS